MKKSILLFSAALFLLIISGSFLHAQNESRLRIEGVVHYFQPADAVFQDIYGGGITYGGEIGIRLGGWISLWAGGDFYSQTGGTTFTGETTELQIIPVYGGLMFEIPGDTFRPYTAFGLGYFLYKEENPIGRVEGGEMGYISQLGVRIHVTGSLFFDIKGSYSYCKTQPAEFETDLGGFKGGIGIGLEFQP